MKLELSISIRRKCVSVIISQISLVIPPLSYIQWQTKLALFLCFNRGRLHFIYHYNSTYTDSILCQFQCINTRNCSYHKGLQAISIGEPGWFIHAYVPVICTLWIWISTQFGGPTRKWLWAQRQISIIKFTDRNLFYHLRLNLNHSNLLLQFQRLTFFSR